MNERLHYLAEFRLDRKSFFLLWYDESPDGFLLDSCGAVANFANSGEAKRFAQMHSIELVDQAADTFDFDAIAAWCCDPHNRAIDCVVFLDAWNMVNDIVSSVAGESEFRAAEASMDELYYKIFDGCNLLQADSAVDRYHPVWSTEEIAALAGIFDTGLLELRSALKA
jgi:hypothetical protein